MTHPTGEDINRDLLRPLMLTSKRFYVLAAFFGAFVVAGLDSGRFGWSGSVPMAVTVVGSILMVTGQVLFASTAPGAFDCLSRPGCRLLYCPAQFPGRSRRLPPGSL